MKTSIMSRLACISAFAISVAYAPGGFAQDNASTPSWIGTPRHALFVRMSDAIEAMQRDVAASPMEWIPTDPDSLSRYYINPTERRSVETTLRELDSAASDLTAIISGSPTLPPLPVSLSYTPDGVVKVTLASGAFFNFDYANLSGLMHIPAQQEQRAETASLADLTEFTDKFASAANADMFRVARTQLIQHLTSGEALDVSRANFEAIGWARRSDPAAPKACLAAQSFLHQSMRTREAAIKGQVQSQFNAGAAGTFGNVLAGDPSDSWEEKKRIFYQSSQTQTAGSLMGIALAGGMEPWLRKQNFEPIRRYGRCLKLVSAGLVDGNGLD